MLNAGPLQVCFHFLMIFFTSIRSNRLDLEPSLLLRPCPIFLEDTKNGRRLLVLENIDAAIPSTIVRESNEVLAAVLEYRSPPIQSGLRNREEIILEFRNIQHIVQNPCPATIVRNSDSADSHRRKPSADTADEDRAIQSS